MFSVGCGLNFAIYSRSIEIGFATAWTGAPFSFTRCDRGLDERSGSRGTFVVRARCPPALGSTEFEDVYCIGCRRDAQEGGCRIKGHAVYVGRHRAATKLVELLGGRDCEYAYYRTFVRSCC